MLGLAAANHIQPPLILDDQNLLSTLVIKVRLHQRRQLVSMLILIDHPDFF